MRETSELHWGQVKTSCLRVLMADAAQKQKSHIIKARDSFREESQLEISSTDAIALQKVVFDIKRAWSDVLILLLVAIL